MFRVWLPLLIVVTTLLPKKLQAQQVTISVPQQNISTGYYEYIGGSWSYYGPGFWASFGGQPFPPYGGFNPNGGLTGGFAFGNGSHGGMFNFNAVQGGSTSFTTTVPMLTVTNGVPGSITAGRFTPFVTGVVPVAGGGLGNNPVFNNLGAANSIAGRAARGEFHIRDGQLQRGPDPLMQLPPELAAGPPLFAPLPDVEADQVPANALPVEAVQDAVTPIVRVPSRDEATSNAKAADLWRKGQALEAEGKLGAAKLLYQTAARQAEGDLRDQIETHLLSLGKTK